MDDDAALGENVLGASSLGGTPDVAQHQMAHTKARIDSIFNNRKSSATSAPATSLAQPGVGVSI